jgi:hypothetical protein
VCASGGGKDSSSGGLCGGFKAEGEKFKQKQGEKCTEKEGEKFRRLFPHNELLKQPTNEPSRRGFRE